VGRPLMSRLPQNDPAYCTRQVSYCRLRWCPAAMSRLLATACSLQLTYKAVLLMERCSTVGLARCHRMRMGLVSWRVLCLQVWIGTTERRGGASSVARGVCRKLPVQSLRLRGALPEWSRFWCPGDAHGIMHMPQQLCALPDSSVALHRY
jgi:hypothetical protein